MKGPRGHARSIGSPMQDIPVRGAIQWWACLGLAPAGAARASREAHADRCGFARSDVSRIERGKANPSLDAIATLAGGLKVRVRELFED